MAHRLVPGADVARTHVVFHCLPEARPVKILRYQRVRAGNAEVACHRCVVVLSQDREDKGCSGRGNSEAAAMVEIELSGCTKKVSPFLTRMCTNPVLATLCDEPSAVVMKALCVLRVGVYSTKCSRSVKMWSVALESRIRESV